MTVPRWAKFTLAAAGIATAALTVSGWLFLRSMSPLARCDDRRFTSAKWMDADASFGEQAIRGCLVDDLHRSHELRGRSRQEIVALLGEPTKTAHFSSYDLVYWLGPERSVLSVDSEWLVMRLDSLGRVSEYRLVTD